MLRLLSLLLLLACGDDTTQPKDDAGERTASGDAKEGRLSGAVVTGLSFQTASEQGTTDERGSFTFREEEEVSFSLGELSLGSVPGSAEVTLQQLGPSADRRGDNVLVLLTSLDRDGDLNNGIEIDRDIAKVASKYRDKVDFDQDVAAFAADEAVVALLAELNEAAVFSDTDPRPRTLRAASSAREHFVRATAKRKSVDTALGAVRGYAANDRTWQWLGVPYARPPLGAALEAHAGSRSLADAARRCRLG